MWLKKILLLTTLFLAGCQPAKTTPIPTPVLWTAQYTPSLAWMGPDLNACTQQISGVALIVREAPASALQMENVNFSILWGPPPEVNGSAAVLGQDELAFITHAGNPATSLSLQQI